MTTLKQIQRVYEELRDTVDFFEAQISTGSRLEMVANNIEEVIETIENLLLDPRLSPSSISEFEELRLRAIDIRRRVRSALNKIGGEEDIRGADAGLERRRWGR